MRGHEPRRAPSGIGALTRKDRYREAALAEKIDAAYRGWSSSPSGRRRSRHLRAARRHERALAAQRKRPQSLLRVIAFLLAVFVTVLVVTRASLTVALVAAGLLVVDLRVLRRRKRLVRHS